MWEIQVRENMDKKAHGTVLDIFFEKLNNLYFGLISVLVCKWWRGENIMLAILSALCWAPF